MWSPRGHGPWAMGLAAARATRSHERTKSASPVGERAFLCYLGIILTWLWDGPGAFSGFAGSPFFPLARLTGLFFPEPPLLPF